MLECIPLRGQLVHTNRSRARPTLQTSLIVQISALVVQLPQLVVLLVVLLQALLWPQGSWRRVHIFGEVVDALRKEGQCLNKLFPPAAALVLDPVPCFWNLAQLLYLHAVMDAVNHREAFSVLQALPVLRGPLSRANDPVLALRGRYGEILPGVGLGGDGVSLRAWRGGLVLVNQRRRSRK